MYYYKVEIDGQISLQTREHKCYGDEFTELTEEEYKKEYQKILGIPYNPITEAQDEQEENEETMSNE